ncbi:MAG TPA: hypothetical protein VE046_08065 [Steroidobacteraceae bacterium]|nr:hypothetical protein [Steroidobacteraceae bacterium]
MQNRTPQFGWLGLIVRLALMAGLFIAVGAVAEDDKAPAPAATPAPAPATQPATPAQPAAPAAKKPDTAAKPASQDDDEGADYDKNAAKRFTPSERTPADKNVSFPVDI